MIDTTQRIEPARLEALPEKVTDLIEGNNTRPRDIERALAGDLEADPACRNLRRESPACPNVPHVAC